MRRRDDSGNGKLIIGTSGGVNITDKYGENILRASSRIPVAVSSVQSFILHKVAATGRAIMPIWNGIAFIRDAASKAAEGQILVTAHMLIDFDWCGPTATFRANSTGRNAGDAERALLERASHRCRRVWLAPEWCEECATARISANDGSRSIRTGMEAEVFAQEL